MVRGRPVQLAGQEQAALRFCCSLSPLHLLNQLVRSLASREVGRSGAAALQQAAVRSAAAAGSGGGEAGGSSSSGSGYRGGRSSRGGSSSGSRSGGRVAGGSRSGGSGGGSGAGSSSGEPWQHEHKEDVRQIRSVLKEYYKRKGGRRLKGARPEAATSSSSGGSGSAAPRTLPPLRRATAAATEAAPAPQQPSTAALGQGARVQAALARATGVQVLPPLRPGRLAEEEKRRVVPLALSAEARSARLEESVSMAVLWDCVCWLGVVVGLQAVPLVLPAVELCKRACRLPPARGSLAYRELLRSCAAAKILPAGAVSAALPALCTTHLCTTILHVCRCGSTSWCAACLTIWTTS